MDVDLPQQQGMSGLGEIAEYARHVVDDCLPKIRAQCSAVVGLPITPEVE
jgi:hypothetical protein